MMWAPLIAIVLGGVFLMSARKDSNDDAVAWAPRGIRNNNPGNIERTATTWQGMAVVQADPRFIVFSEPFYGIRALARILRTYRQNHGLTTVRGIINRWAPSFENDTDAYVRHAARALGVAPDEPLSFDASQLRTLVAVIIQHENGQQPYSMAELDAGIRAGWS